jgi:hypothetical protein
VKRSIVAAAAVVLVAASVSGATEQPPPPLETAMPAPAFGSPASGPFSAAEVVAERRPLGKGAPGWARRLYDRSIDVLVALTNPRSGAMIAGEREGWDYVWPRDASAGAMALQAAGLHAEARRVVGFLGGLDLGEAARFHPDGTPVPGRTAAGDGEGWVAAAQRSVVEGSANTTVLPSGRLTTTTQDGPGDWTDRQDYGENVSGDLLGNAIASRVPADEILSRFGTTRGLLRQEGGDELDSSAAWAVTLFPQPGLRAAARDTLLHLARESAPFGISPMEGWTPGEVWTAPTAWTAWALVKLGDTGAADRLLRELRRAATPYGTLPERVSASDGHPTSTTPLAWSHAFAILALRARYPG